METNDAGLALIKYWERNPKTGTFYDRAYQDEEGVWTIGFGTIRWDLKTPVKEGDMITREEADRQLRKEVQRCDDAIDRCVKVLLTANEHSCLSSWAYNVGIGWVTGEGHQQATFIKQLNKGNYAGVPAGLMQFTKGAKTGNHYDGLLNRRKMECKLWLTPDEEPHAVPAIPAPVADDVPAVPMPQAVTQQKGSAVQAAKESWTLRGAALAFVTYAAQQGVSAYDWLFSVAKEAGPQVMDLKGAIGPFDALLAALRVSMPALFAILTLTGIVIVVMRRISAAHEGRIG